jgi:uncharacterized protein
MSHTTSHPDKPMTVACPTCGKAVIWSSESTWRPFCSERCRLIDLGDWLDENHRIPDSQGGYGGDGSSDGAED